MKDDRVYLGHILRCIARIEEYTVEGRDKFFASPLVQDGVIRNLQTLAESSLRLGDAVKALHPDVDWKGWLDSETSWFTTISALISSWYIVRSSTTFLA